MGSFSIWHWIVVLVFFGILASIVYAIAQSSRKVNAKGQPEGIEGWLLLLAIALSLAPLRTLSEISKNIVGYEQMAALPNGSSVAYFEIALLLSFMVLQIVVAVAFFRKKRTFPRLFMFQWIDAPILMIVDVLVVSYLFRVAPGMVLTSDILAPTLAAFVVGAIWLWYLSKPVRAQNTFTR